VMANNLNRLSHLLDRKAYLNTAKAMLLVTSESVLTYPSGHANWLNLALSLNQSQYEIAIAGDNAIQLSGEMQKSYLPNCIFCPGNSEKLPLLYNRITMGKTKIYVCENQSCRLPTEQVDEALKLII